MQVVAVLEGRALTLQGTIKTEKDALKLPLDTAGEEPMKIATPTEDTLVSKGAKSRSGPGARATAKRAGARGPSRFHRPCGPAAAEGGRPGCTG